MLWKIMKIIKAVSYSRRFFLNLSNVCSTYWPPPIHVTNDLLSFLVLTSCCCNCFEVDQAYFHVWAFWNSFVRRALFSTFSRNVSLSQQSCFNLFSVSQIFIVILVQFTAHVSCLTVYKSI